MSMRREKGRSSGGKSDFFYSVVVPRQIPQHKQKSCPQNTGQNQRKSTDWVYREISQGLVLRNNRGWGQYWRYDWGPLCALGMIGRDGYNNVGNGIWAGSILV